MSELSIFAIYISTKEASELIKTYRSKEANPQWSARELQMQSLAAEVVLLSISFSSYILRCLFSASDVPFFWLPVPIDISEDILSVFFGFDAPQPAATSKKYAEIPMLAAMERKCGMPRLQWYGRKVGKFCQST